MSEPQQAVMELLVQPEERIEVILGVFLLQEILTQFLDHLGVGIGRDVFHGGQLHGLAQELGISYALSIDARDERSDLGEHLNQPVLGEHDERLTYRSARHPKLSSELIL